MLITILYILAGIFVIATVVILLYLYRTREERNLGISHYRRRQQGIQLILWFAFLAVLLNVLLERLVNLLGDRYVLVLLPTLLLMSTIMLAIIYQKKAEGEEEQ